MPDRSSETTKKKMSALQGSGRAEAVYRATLAIATELSIDTVLQKIVDAARELINTRYAALGVIDEEQRRLARFVVSGVTQEQVEALGHWPYGLGLLGELIHFPRPLRVKDISKDPRSVGFPPNHPPMRSFLGVPIIRGDTVLGIFYMTDKIGAEEFSDEDEEILSLFAIHAAIAIENARLYTATDARLRQKVLEVERAEKRARFLADLGAVLLRLPPGEMPPLETVAEMATEPLADAAAVYMVDPANPEEVTTRAVYHRVPHRREASQQLIERSWENMKDHVVRERSPALVPAAKGQVSQHVFNPATMEELRFSAALAVPIATRQTTYGVLVALATRPLTLTQDDLFFAILIADRLGSTLDSARLFREQLEAKRQVEELASLAERRASELETILDTMAEAVYVVDKQMQLVRMNRAYARLAGIGDKEPGPISFLEHLERLRPRTENPDATGTNDLPASRALRGETFTNHVVRISPAGGNGERFLGVSGAPIRGASGEVVAAVNVARDVTEITELDHMKDEFISVASHEIKTPLTVIKGYAQILRKRLEAGRGGPDEANMAGQLLEQANKMTALADRLLDVSRIQFGRLVLEKQHTDLSSLVSEVAERMQVGAQHHAIRVSAGQPVQAEVDPGRME